MKALRINFDAIKTSGEVVADITFEISPFYPEENPVAIGDLRLQRLCVEYARLIGYKCSFADIHDISEVE